ncbi:unnamed protein product [Ostreobium quekettii]|uniref:Uncharacterized protein n=1 Tax=Ostreobium quekettii TaxID=121088 RepID=A0A8S1JD22_9CHLO|nr:unnamed protein product [Ostreobium quekettii]
MTAHRASAAVTASSHTSQWMRACQVACIALCCFLFFMHHSDVTRYAMMVRTKTSSRSVSLPMRLQLPFCYNVSAAQNWYVVIASCSRMLLVWSKSKKSFCCDIALYSDIVHCACCCAVVDQNVAITMNGSCLQPVQTLQLQIFLDKFSDVFVHVPCLALHANKKPEPVPGSENRT